MNKSEIAEKAAREIVAITASSPYSYKVLAPIVERAIAESQAHTNRHGEKCSQACGEGRHSECTETMATCNCTYRGAHKTSHRYANTPAGDGEPSPKVGGVYTGLRGGCTSDPSGLHECGVEENHKLCVCANCGANWPNPEWHGAAQEVSPPSPELIGNQDWTELAVGQWFFVDSPSCTYRYSVQERTDSGYTVICDSPWHTERAKANMQEIAEAHNRGDTRELKAALPLCVCHDVFYENCPTFKKGICITISGATSSQLG